MRRGLIAAPILYGLFSTWLTPTWALGAEPRGVQFDQEGPVSVSASRTSDGESPAPIQAVRFALINAAGGQANISLTLTPLSGPATEIVLPISLSGSGEACAVSPAEGSSTSAEITAPAGAICSLVYQVDVSSPPGTYAATFVASDRSTGTADTLSVTVTIKEAPSPSNADPNQPVLTAPLPDPITLVGFSRSPWPDAPTIAIDPTSASSVTPLLGADGTVVATTYDDGQLTVPTVPAAGVYTGNLVKSDGTSAAKVTLTVKDWWVWPFLLTVIGVIAAFVGQRWTSRIRPRWVFEGRLEALRAQESAAKAREEEWLRKVRRETEPAADPPIPGRSPIDVLGPNGEGILSTALAKALEMFASYEDPAARDTAFAPDGDKWKNLTEICETAEACRTEGEDCIERYWRLSEALRQPPRLAKLFRETSIFSGDARVALDGDVFLQLADLKARRTARETLRRQLDRAVTYIVEAARLRKMGADSSKVANIEAQLARMSTSDESEWKKVESAAAEARNTLPTDAATSAIADEGRRLWTPIRQEAMPSALTALPASVSPPTHPKIPTAPAPTDLAGKAVAAAKLAIRKLRSALRPGWLLDRIKQNGRVRWGEAVYVVFVFLVAILTAFNTSYVGKASFGSLADYLTLFVLAIGTTAVLELAKGTIVSRLLPRFG